MTADVGQDLPTERPQAVVRGQIRRPVATVTTAQGQCHKTHEWAAT
jgi:hypothetical protein